MARCKAVEHFARLAVVLCLFHDDQLDDEGESAYQCVRSLLLVRSWPVDYDVDRITAQAARVLHSPQLLQSWTMESFGLYAYHFDLIETGEDVELRLKCVRHIYEHETIMHNLISALVMFTSADFGANDEDYGLVSLRVGVAEINFANLMQDHLATTVEEADGRTPVENPWTAQLTLADVENVEEGTRCTICLVRDAVDEPFQLSCNCKVMYHQDCINRWFATRDVNCRTSEVQCVYCRQPVRATIGAQVEDEEQDTFARYQ